MSSAGSYVIAGTKKALRFYRRHFSKLFTFWILGITNFLSRILFPLAPLFQHFRYQLARMIDKSGEVFVSKCFEEKEGSYGQLLLFDILWFLFAFGGTALIAGIGIWIYFLVINIDYYFYPSGEIDQGKYGEFMNNALFLVIPFLVLAGVYFIYSLIVLQAATYTASRNRSLKLSDIAFDAFASLKKFGGKLFAIDLLYFLELLTFAAIVVVPIFILIVVFPESDSGMYTVHLPDFIIWILLAIESVLAIFFFPCFNLSADISLYRVFSEGGISDIMVIALPEKSENNEENKKYTSLSPRDDDSGEEKTLIPEPPVKKEKPKKKNNEEA